MVYIYTCRCHCGQHVYKLIFLFYTNVPVRYKSYSAGISAAMYPTIHDIKWHSSFKGHAIPEGKIKGKLKSWLKSSLEDNKATLPPTGSEANTTIFFIYILDAHGPYVLFCRNHLPFNQ